MVIDGTTGVPKKSQTFWGGTALVEVEEGLKIIPGANTIIASFDKIVNWGRLSSLWPMTFGLA
jgi:NADH-quinone oxidoreductase subunit B